MDFNANEMFNELQTRQKKNGQKKMMVSNGKCESTILLRCCIFYFFCQRANEQKNTEQLMQSNHSHITI